MWIQISAGRGPVECQRAVALLAEEILKERPGSKILESEPGDEKDTFHSVLIAIESEDSFDRALWQGSVLWRCESSFRPGHKRKNWFVGVECFEDVEVPKIQETEFRFETLRSSGPGGQNVNKVETAVRVVHVPTGLSALGREERSQGQNRKLAWARLLSRLDSRASELRAQKTQELWQAHNDLERGNPIRVYQGAEFRRIR